MPVQEFTTEELESEEWRYVIEFENIYEVPNIGRVCRIRPYRGMYAGRIVEPSIRRGYPFVTLRDGQRKKQINVHLLVAKAFIGPRPDGFQVNHKDGIKLNRRVSNLEYVTPSENCIHALATGLASNKCPHPASRGEMNNRARLTVAKVVRMRLLYDNGFTNRAALGRLFHVGRTTVGNVIERRTWTHV